MGKSKRSKNRSKTSAKGVEFATAKIGFVGAGKIAEALITGLVNYGKVEPARIAVSAPTNNNTDRLKQTFPGLKTTKRNIDIFAKFDSDIVFIVVNGCVIRNLYKMGGSRPAALTTNYIPNMRHPLYILTLIPGFPVSAIKEVLLNPENPEKYLIEFHRCVINCAVAYGLGVCAIDVEPDSKKLAEPVRSMLTTVCKHVEFIPAGSIDAAQALIGPSLAYCYYLINEMGNGGVKIGLSRPNSVKLTAKAVSVAAQTLLETGKHPNDLRDEVCAPSGGGIYATTVLDKGDVASAVAGAVEAACKHYQASAKGE